MDSPIQGPVQPASYAAHYMSRPPKRKEEEAGEPLEQGEEELDVVLEPQPRQADHGAAVSRKRLEDEAGQIIDLRG